MATWKLVAQLVIACFVQLIRSSGADGCYGELIPVLSDLICDDCLVSAFPSVSVIECAALCVDYAWCLSFVFDLGIGSCQLQSTLLKTSECGTYRYQKGARYYTMCGRPMFPASLPIGYAYESLIGGWYKVQMTEYTWRDANASCHCDGGHLLTIRSQVVQDWIESLLITDYADGDRYFVDGNDISNEGDWRFHDGSSVTFTSWYPTNIMKDGQDCLMLDNKYVRNFKWNDGSCNNERRYICHIDSD